MFRVQGLGFRSCRVVATWQCFVCSRFWVQGLRSLRTMALRCGVQLLYKHESNLVIQRYMHICVYVCAYISMHLAQGKSASRI